MEHGKSSSIEVRRVRVIGGVVKGRRIRSVPGKGTRPVTGRVKGAVFDIIGPEILEQSFLDLFAGTGSLGIEALSRGANRATFVESDRRAVATIRENLELTGLAARADVIHKDVFRFLKTTGDVFDIVYVAPPQYRSLWKRTMLALDAEDSPAADLVVVQIHPKEFESLGLKHLALADSRKYGSTSICFYRRLD